MKIISFIPIPFFEAGNFTHRDLGLVTLGFRALGVDAWFALLPGDSLPKEKFFLTPSRKDVADPRWWKQQKADGILINTWSSPRFDDIRSAVCAVGCPVVEKLDTDGVKSPKIYPVHSFRRGWVDYDRRHFFKSRLPKTLYAVLRFVGNGLFPFLLDKKMIRCMQKVPYFAAETPLAAERVRRFLAIYSARPMPKVFHIPHPVDTQTMFFSKDVNKSNLVVAVGRWHDAVKGWPLLERLSCLFLTQNPTWKIVAIGLGSKELGQQLKRRFPKRFQGLGNISHYEIGKVFQRAKIYLLTSHSETFNIAAAEAVCCGCSFVGPTQIPSSPYFSCANSGTVSHLRKAVHMLDALNAEVGEWSRGRRNPLEISKFWESEVGYKQVAAQYLQIFTKVSQNL